MNFNMKTAIWILPILLLSGSFIQFAYSQQANPSVTPPQPLEYSDLPVNIETPIQPIPVKGSDGKWYLVYHLFLTNWSFSDLTLKSVEVFDEKRNKTLARYEDKELSEYYRFRTLIPTPPRSELPNNIYPRQISSGRTGVLFFWLTVDAPNLIPLALRHRFTFEPNPLIKLLSDSAKDKGDMVLDNFKVAVSKDKPVVIGSPLRGGDWRCGNGPAYNTNHQFLTIRAGKVTIAQRFGIDFRKVDAGGNVLPSPFPDEITNKMFYGYGAEILAVADGVVTFTKDGIPENVPQASGEIKPAVPLTRETNAGNWLSIDLGKKRYAFYAHLQPGSIRVKAGDKVRKGQVIGLLGNSGNSVGPHLHFHIGDEYSLNGGDLNGNEGLPFVFDSFNMKGQPRRRILEMPLNNSVVQFP
jgi:Peptidase family M23